MYTIISLVLFAIGTATAAIAAATPMGEELWWLLAVGSLIIVAGIILNRIGMREAAAKAAATEDGLDISQVTALINGLPGKCREILGKIETSPKSSEEIFTAVDNISKEDLYNIVENRSVLAYSLGTKAFPVLFGEFAEGERLFNRTWSALCDRHVEEARASLSQAVEFFESVSLKLQGSPTQNNQI
ncbi:MAG: hypothetical protein ACYS8W_02530 [Planctomycetota bacterium]|jgi:hypothetical protein